MRKSFAVWAAAALVAIAPAGAQAYSNIFFFGDSLSDSGNNRLVFDSLNISDFTPVPISGNDFIPSLPYASGRYTTDQVWATAFAANFGRTALPSFAGGSNFAFGGATTGPSPSGFPFSLRHQVENQFLPAVQNQAPGDALYVIAGGGNNARAALEAIGTGADIGQTIAAAASTYAGDVAAIIASLRQRGADEFIVWNVPDLGRAPAILEQNGPGQGNGVAGLATGLSAAMNGALIDTLAAVPGLDDGVKVFNLFGLLNAIASSPASFGLTDATTACAALANCDPSKYLFWDGIHPTSAGHAIIAGAMIALVPEPSTYALLIAGLLAIAWTSRRRAAR